MIIDKCIQKYRNANIANKITIAYVSCFVVLLAIINAVMYFGVFYALYKPAEKTILFSMDNIKKHLDDVTKNATAFDPYAMQSPLVAGVILRVVDDNGEIFADTGPQYVSNDTFNQHIIDHTIFANDNFDIADVGGALVYRAKLDYILNNQHFNLFFLRTITSEKDFIYNLETLLIVLDIAGIILAVTFGKFISNKLLKPIINISKNAQIININNINSRVDVPTDNDELSNLAKNFNAMLDRINSGVVKQSNFVSDASHELKTPAAIITNYAELINTYPDDKAIVKEAINAITAESNYIISLIHNLATLAKVDNINLNFKSIDLHNTIINIVNSMKIIDSSKTIQIINNDNANIYADYTTFQQIVRIFIDNAIKYTPAGGIISINSINKGNRVKLSISDTGIGIAPHNISKIFDRFFRVNYSDNIKGTGLGLSIAKRIADLHNINIEVNSILGKGTTFT